MPYQFYYHYSLVFNLSFSLSILIYLSHCLARVLILNLVLIILYYFILNKVPEDWMAEKAKNPPFFIRLTMMVAKKSTIAVYHAAAMANI